MSQLTIFNANDSQQAIFNSSKYQDISKQLANVGILFERWQAHIEVGYTDNENYILSAYAEDISRLKEQGGYRAVDVISLDPSHPDKEALRKKFFIRTHS
ncbi:cupin domain-containing protein [Piscirickettsia litoralis]|uniref:hypothetical protein n=1 Tax=Piscirickettsia litoralis TaxID=1891921 RepID=UPI001F1C9816|nr:hypothetical protein [Piscirickettsia litoralis]